MVINAISYEFVLSIRAIFLSVSIFRLFCIVTRLSIWLYIGFLVFFYLPSISTQLREFLEGRRPRKSTFAHTKSDQSGSIHGGPSPPASRLRPIGGVQGRSRELVWFIREERRGEESGSEISRRPYKVQTAAVRPLGSNNAAWARLRGVS